MNIKISLLKYIDSYGIKKNMLSLKLVQNLVIFQSQSFFYLRIFRAGNFPSGSANLAIQKLQDWTCVAQSNGKSGLRRLPGLVNVYQKLMGKIHHVNYFYGHFLCRQLLVYQRVNPISSHDSPLLTHC
jgi:hypothetical protein